MKGYSAGENVRLAKQLQVLRTVGLGVPTKKSLVGGKLVGSLKYGGSGGSDIHRYGRTSTGQ